MIIRREVSQKNIEDYRSFLSDKQWTQLLNSAREFRGKKIVHVNATPKGGGVVEILDSLVGLQQALGINSQWFYFQAEPEFFEFTKDLHNGLQGASFKPSNKQEDIYTKTNQQLAKELEALQADVYIIHDPQPMASVAFMKPCSAILRLHPDLTAPSKEAFNFISQYFPYYQKIVYSIEEFIPPNIDRSKVVVSAPAIDPLSMKNRPLSSSQVKTVLASVGIDPMRPLITQISRFDLWKDYSGVLEAYALVKKDFPDIQLALIGVIEAQDDPEALEELQKITKLASTQKDVHIFSDPAQLGEYDMATFINAIQRGSEVILQKSIREGFGMTVTEAMWKGKPVIGGNVGGIRTQIENDVSGFLVDSVEEAAERIAELIDNPLISYRIGKNAHLSVHENFLIMRLLIDELSIMQGTAIISKYENRPNSSFGRTSPA